MWRLLLALPLLAACDGGCETDKDCKAERICDAELRACVDADTRASASSLQVCLGGCAAQKRCGVINDASAATCRTACDAMRDDMTVRDAEADARCSFAARDRAADLACKQRPCNEIGSCAASVDRRCPPR